MIILLSLKITIFKKDFLLTRQVSKSIVLKLLKVKIDCILFYKFTQIIILLLPGLEADNLHSCICHFHKSHLLSPLFLKEESVQAA